MLGYLVFYLNFIIIVFALAIKLDMKTDMMFFLSIVLISIVEYVVGMVFDLLIARVIISIFTVVCLGYLIYVCIKKKSIKILIDKITHGFILFSLLYIFSIYLYGSRIITQHNELGIWALVVKNMNLTDTLPKYGSNMLYTGYIPITGLWHYWVMSFFGEFFDGYITLSSTFLQLSLVIGITSFIKDKSWIRNILVNFIFIGFLYIVSILVFGTTYVDPIMGLVVSFITVYIINIDFKNIKRDVILIILFSSYLLLVKENAIVFEVAILIFLFMRIFSNKNIDKKRLIFPIIFIIIIPFLLKFVWNIYLTNNNLNIAGDISDISLKNVVDIFIGYAPNYRYNTIFEYISYILVEPVFKILKIDVSVMSFLVFAIIVMLLLYFKYKDKEIINLIITIFLFAVFFLGSLLFVYLFVFAEWEAIYLSAIIRYVQTIDIIILCSLLYIVIDKMKNKNIIIIALVLILFITGENRAISMIKNRDFIIINAQEKRKEYEKIENYRELFTMDDKIYFVSDYNGVDYFTENYYKEIGMLITKYQITPYKVYMHPSEDLIEEQILDKLNLDYTYIYFHNVTSKVREQYDFLLVENEEIYNYDIFKIIDIDGKMKIKKINIPEVIVTEMK